MRTNSRTQERSYSPPINSNLFPTFSYTDFAVIHYNQKTYSFSGFLLSYQCTNPTAMNKPLPLLHVDGV